jgi:predicted RNA binding protein YcfA (HicA-like mRNA interferase family)
MEKESQSMMTQRDKLLAKIQNNPKAATFQELDALLRQHGFVLDRVRGSHHRYELVGVARVTVARHGAVVPEREVRQVLDAVLQARARNPD